MITQEQPSSPDLLPAGAPAAERTIARNWPALLFAAALLLVYVPEVVSAAKIWMVDETYSHCFAIIPLSLFMLWLERDKIAAAKGKPSLWGLVPLVSGLSVEMVAYICRLPHIGMWTLPVSLCGAALLVGGNELWKATRYPIGYLLLAGSMPGPIFLPINHIIQHISISCAAFMGDVLGFPLIRRGETIDVPGVSLEVMLACSGYRKLMVLVTFALLYGFLFTNNPLKRLGIALSAIPIAVIVNCLRITLLIGVSTAGGMKMFTLFHEPSDILAIIIAFALMILVGMILKCKNPRFSL